MLTVAGPTSGTEAEQVAHRFFTQWDTGIRVLGGVAAFRPYDESGTNRRQSDLVLLVPDGVIVVRLVASQRQSGPIVTHPTGAWSIGGEVLRIIGGGSNPLPALRDAQAAVAAALRANGLEPGRIAMLVAVGAGEPVAPEDGQLDDGVIVCPLSDEGLAIGVRRAAALAAAADVRQWTTADVKAALSSLQATGRVPAVEELNSEGFMYSPYILRRPDLVAAATAFAASTAVQSSGPTTTAPQVVPGPTIQPTVSSPASPASPGVPVPPAASAGPAVPAAPSPQVVPPSGHAATEVQQHPTDADEGLAGIFDDDPEPVTPSSTMSAAQWSERFGPEGRDDYGAPDDNGRRDGRSQGDRPDSARSRGDSAGRRRIIRVVAVLAALVLLAVAAFIGFGLFTGDEDGDVQSDQSSGAPSSSSVPTTSAAAPSTQQIGEYTYVPALSRAGETCAGNANGDVAAYFETTDCTSLSRELYRTEIDGVQVLVSVARITMPDEASAEEFKSLVDSDGTGNVNDLLEAGDRIEGGPAELIPVSYASDLEGADLTIVVAGWFDPAVTGDEEALGQLTTEALALTPLA